MVLSVVVSTLNDREQLLSCLDALTERTPPRTEVIVVNGPSSDGTTGVVRERTDVDVLVEISERSPNVSRNAGLEAATGDIVAFLDGACTVEPGWYDAIERSLETEVDIVSGPITGRKTTVDDLGHTRTVAGRSVTPFDADNVAFDRTVLDALDGFDEYLDVGGDRDCAHRVAGLGFEVDWCGEMAVRSEIEADGGTTQSEWGSAYRSLSYRLAKNYGPRPTVLIRTVASAVRDGVFGVRRIFSGDVTPTGWVSDGIEVLTNVACGARDGLRARYADRSARRNPNGISVRHDRAVRLYDWR
ncbi:glycosyltransferase family 2 protein [Natrarchaeobius halalkaliphilus]|uniref:Glycosyltransferase family 2 protein n=1 Tax=Natrarchaeobius halalkaliphilus TaxID=1679091 RepID=A0A3N6P1I0_9EURY|nr:glycosyltransferase family A protein [Natrarchaeobius halalkaliphilus]RQG88935.1 glycosyltransferase family 2 protein [Natrarchaeobius halalkaliphilus]